jgi:ribosome-associated protein
VVLDLRKLSAFADYFVIATGASDRQVQAISDRIQGTLKEHQIRPLGVEGYQKGHWILVDCGSVIAHVFYEEARAFYALDKLWGDAAKVRFALK